MKRYYAGDTIIIPGRSKPITGTLTGVIFDDERGKVGFEVDDTFYPLSKFEGIEIKPTKYDLSVRVMNGAEHSV